MKRQVWLMAAWFGLALLAGVAGCDDKKTRNPFDVPDVERPDGADVKEFAKGVKLAGDNKDKNSGHWVEKETAGNADSLDGEWPGRWEGAHRTATVKGIKD